MSFLILQVQAALKAEGFLIQRTPLHSSGWLAYNPALRAGTKPCVLNGMPPQLIIYVVDATVHGVKLRSVEFEIYGQIPSSDPAGISVKSTVFGFTFNTAEDVIAAIPVASAIGSAVWDAAYTANQSLSAQDAN